MRPLTTIPFAAMLLIAGLSFGIHRIDSSAERKQQDAGFAVVELFTSEGCSSCPPADELAMQISDEFPGRVIYLGYHVDYWDYIGWKDRFARAEFTVRQRNYAKLFDLNSIYTPQVVINGRKEFVGSDKFRVRKTIQEEIRKRPAAELDVTAKRSGNRIMVTYKSASIADHELQIALLQTKAETPVKRGENSGRRLEHINVVRELKTISLKQASAGQTVFMLPPGLSFDEIKVVAFVQDKKTLLIQGAVLTKVL